MKKTTSGVDALTRLAAEGLEHAPYFLLACLEGTKGGAAELIGCTDTTISNHVKSLMTVLKLPIAIESGPLELTPAGERIWNRCEASFRSLYTDWRDAIEAEKAPRLHIAATETAARYEIPQALAKWRNEFPDLPIQIDIEYYSEIPELVQTSRVRLGLTRHETTKKLLDLGTEIYEGPEWRIAVPQGYEDSKPEELNAQLGWVLPEHSRWGRVVLEELLGELEPRILLNVASYDVAAAYAQAGVAAAFLPSYAIEGCREEFRLLPSDVIPKELRQHVQAILWKGPRRLLHKWEQAFVDIFISIRAT